MKKSNLKNLFAKVDKPSLRNAFQAMIDNGIDREEAIKELASILDLLVPANLLPVPWGPVLELVSDALAEPIVRAIVAGIEKRVEAGK